MGMRAVCVYALILLAPCSAGAALEGPVTVLMAPTRHDVAPGETVTINVFVKNNLTASPPLVLSATASFVDDDGNQQVTTATLDLAVMHPIHVHQVTFAIPDPLVYVPHTTATKGRPLTAAANGKSLSIILDTDIAEQDTVLVTLDVSRPKD